MKATIEINEETMDRLSGALNLPPLYDEDYGVDEEALAYAVNFTQEAVTVAYVEALAAIHKQIPQKIIFNSEDDREYEDYICPNCKDILQQRRKGATAITIYRFKYCHNCGQALDWDN